MKTLLYILQWTQMLTYRFEVTPVVHPDNYPHLRVFRIKRRVM